MTFNGTYVHAVRRVRLSAQLRARNLIAPRLSFWLDLNAAH